MSVLPELEARLRTIALTYPEAHEDFPWGERVVKVRGKIFLFLGLIDGVLRIGAKLPASHPMALMFDGCTPTGYGLGQHGWVSIRLDEEGGGPDPDLLSGWVDESYRAVAPKALVKLLD